MVVVPGLEESGVCKLVATCEYDWQLCVCTA